MKRFIFGGILLFILLAIVLTVANAFYPRGKVQQSARPYSFSLFQWEVRNFPDKWFNGVVGLFFTKPSKEKEDAQVSRYFALMLETDALAREIREKERSPASQGTASMDELKNLSLNQLEQEKNRLEDRVEEVLESRLTEVMTSEGLALVFADRSLLFPPVDFKFTLLPRVLVTSPRKKIELKDTILLRSDMTSEDVERLEKMVEGQELSALVDRIGGFSAYPSMVPSSTSLPFTLSTVAHEWLHHYFFFQPLGRHYWDNYSMVIINETTADIAAEEIADLIIKRYGSAWGEAAVPRKEGADSRQEQPSFFNQQMRQVRLRVDELLSQGSVAEAERFMEEQRLLLAGKGYHIRRLNQAYFAFHGAYGTSPAASSPIGGELRQLRKGSASVGEFIRKVRSVSSYEQLKTLLEK